MYRPDPGNDSLYGWGQPDRLAGRWVAGHISGVFMLYVASLLWTNSLAMLTTQFSFLYEWGLVAESWVSTITGTGGNVIGAGAATGAMLAFMGGLISFLSPCVLPLVSAYIGFLSGAAVGRRRMAL
jgi:cytochrome c-type biogenesis protein